MGVILVQKGALLVTLKKVKWHATFEMVVNGEVPHDETYGNDKADKAADMG